MLKSLILIILLTYATSTPKYQNPYKHIRYTQRCNNAVRAVLINKAENYDKCYKKTHKQDECILREENKKDILSSIYRLKKAGYKTWLRLIAK